MHTISLNLLEQAPFGVIALDVEGNVVFANSHAGHILELTPDQLLNTPWPKQQTQISYSEILPRLKEGETWTGILKYPRKKGPDLLCRHSYAPTKNDKGGYAGCLIYLQDVSEKHALKQQVKSLTNDMEVQIALRTKDLRESENRFRTIVDNMPGGYVYRCAMDKDWTIHYISGSIEGLTGYPSAEFTESRVRTFASIIHPEDAQHVEEMVISAVSTAESFKINYRLLHKNGSVIYVREIGRGVCDRQGNVLWLDGTVVQIDPPE